MARGLSAAGTMDELQTAPESTQNFDRELALSAFRFAMGVNIFMHGAVRVVGDLGGFVSGTVKGFAATILPAPLVQVYAYGLSFAELMLGAPLLFGLATRPVLVALILVMASLMFGMSLRQE